MTIQPGEQHLDALGVVGELVRVARQVKKSLAVAL